jgi:hypothetical protein
VIVQVLTAIGTSADGAFFNYSVGQASHGKWVRSCIYWMDSAGFSRYVNRLIATNGTRQMTDLTL